MNRHDRRAALDLGARGTPSPATLEVLFVEATLLHKSGKVDKAERLYRLILSQLPDHAGALSHLGVIARDRGLLDEALDLLRRAATIDRTNAAIQVNLSGALRALGFLDQAIATSCYAVELAPDSKEAFINLGNLLMDAKRPADAAIAFARVLPLGKADANLYARLALALIEAGRVEDAANAYELALDLAPQSADLHVQLAEAMIRLNRHPQALEALKRALRFEPDHRVALRLLASLLEQHGQSFEALAILLRLEAMMPDNLSIQFEALHLRRYLCDWRSGSLDGTKPFDAELHYSPFKVLALGGTPAQQKRYADRWARRFFDSGSVRLWSAADDRTSRGERIRIAYLSSDFYEHATTYLISELIERHDRSRFEVAAYSYGTSEKGAAGERIAMAFDRFVDIASMPNAASARAIHADGIDILIDLKGYTKDSRSDILAWRPAPVQVNYLGYPGTLGDGLADYIIADNVIAPMADQPYFSERIVQLPHCYQPNDTKRPIATPPSRAACGLPEGAFVFCSFNNSYKLTPQIFDVWMRLLAALPRSVLWLFAPNRHVAGNLRREAVARGVDPDRLIFAPHLTLAEHLGRHAHADLFLDSLPVNAHTTASDALWAGLPVLTMPGNSFVGRVAASLNRAVGLSELVAGSVEEYEALAIRLATEPGLLAGYRDRLACYRRTSPLFDIARYTRNIEAAYERMMEIHRAGRPPEAFAIIE